MVKAIFSYLILNKQIVSKKLYKKMGQVFISLTGLKTNRYSDKKEVETITGFHIKMKENRTWIHIFKL